ncbi:MAG: hypothetical protein IPL65_08640 [Lewinellaceae bacterium]|nr:hypothetical protein [Lewinellaceae bacterium]
MRWWQRLKGRFDLVAQVFDSNKYHEPYYPYTAIEDSPEALHLKMESRALRFNILILRVLPVLVFAGLLVTLPLLDNRTPWWVYAGLALVGMHIVAWMNSAVVLELQIDQSQIMIYTLHFFRKSRVTYPLAAIMHFIIQRNTTPHTAGAYYYASLRDNKKVALVKLPIGPWRKPDGLRLLKERMEHLTQLHVSEEGRPLAQSDQ